MLLAMLLTTFGWSAETLVLGAPVRVTLGSANVTTEIILPVGTRRVWVRFETNDGALTTSGTDGGTKSATDYFIFTADLIHDYRPESAGCGCPGRLKQTPRIYLSTATG